MAGDASAVSACRLALLALLVGRCISTGTAVGRSREGLHSALMRAEGRTERGAACAPYPGRRVVVVSVDADYRRFFENWLLYAEKVLDDNVQIVAHADDALAAEHLRSLVNPKKAGAKARFEIAESEGQSFLELSASSTPWGTRNYHDLVHRRPGFLFHYLQQGCEALLADVDTVWLKNPFDEIDAAGVHDVILMDDGVKKKQEDLMPQPVWHADAQSCPKGGFNFCGCLVFARPTQAGLAFIEQWSQNVLLSNYANVGNQPPLNDLFCKRMDDLDFAVVRWDAFPAGQAAREVSDPTIMHANWIINHQEKVTFLKDMGHWLVSDGME